MTAIAGLVENGVVYIGGDSAGVGGYDLTARTDAKVFHNGPFLFGFTSSFRMGDLLRYSLTPPSRVEGIDDDRKFMCTSLIDAIRSTLKQGGYASTINSGGVSGEENGGTFLVGYRGRLYTIYNDYQVGEAADGYHAVGCGDNFALGVLFATKHLGAPPEQRILLALEAAERHSAGVRGPFTILRQDPWPPRLTPDEAVTGTPVKITNVQFFPAATQVVTESKAKGRGRAKRS